jgi:hypothetical protein
MLAASTTSVATSIITCMSTQNSIQTGYHLCMIEFVPCADPLLTSIGDLRPEIAADPKQTAQVSISWTCTSSFSIHINMVPDGYGYTTVVHTHNSLY